MRASTASFGLGICLFAASSLAFAHSLKQQLAAYADNQGTTRQRVGYDLAIDGRPGTLLTSSSYELNVIHDNFLSSQTHYDTFDQAVYGGGEHINDTAMLTTSQTWSRETETRQLLSYATDKHVSSRSFGGGLSRWLWHESLRLSLDLSRTLVSQPLYQVLDYDSELVGVPPLVTSTGTTLSLRHLASPTSIVDYSWTHIDSSNRPAANTGSVTWRQFFPELDAAAHLSAARAYNRGRITTESGYGQVDAWIYETAFLKNLWRGGACRVAYRYYKEDQVARAYNDESILASDTYALGFSQEIPKKVIDGLDVPLLVDASAARYLNNINVAANSYELGLSAKF